MLDMTRFTEEFGTFAHTPLVEGMRRTWEAICDEWLRVLHLTESMGAGVQNLLFRLAGRQAEAGADVSVHYLDRPEAPPADELRGQFDPRVALVRIDSAPAALRRLMASFVAARRALRSRDFDVIHLHSSFAGFAGRLAKLVTPSPTKVMYSPHGYSFLRLSSPPPVRLLWQLLEAAMARVGVSVLTSESELAVGRSRLRPREAVLLHTGVEVSRYDAERSHRLAEPPVVAMVGRICYQKAPWRFAAVAEALHGMAQFVWVGDGDASDRSRWLDGTEVEVAGWLDEKSLRDFLAETTVLLFPTLWEGMSMSLMQAQAQGVPAIVSDAVGNRDAVRHGVTGYVIRTDDELISRTRELLLDPELRDRMSEAAVAWARTGLSDVDLGTDSLSLYRLALGRHGVKG